MSSRAPDPAAPGPPDAAPGGAGHPRAATAGRIARVTSSAVLTVLACILVPLTLIAVWVHDIALDTNRYVATVAPLARNRAVQDAAAARLSKAVDVRVNGEQAAAQLSDWLRSQGLPPQAADAVHGLGPQLDAAVNDTVHRAATRVVRSDHFARAWEQANRRAHATVVHALTGEGRGAVGISDGTVTVDLGTAVDDLKKELTAAGLAPAAAIPTPDKQLVLLDSDQLGKIRKGAHALDILGNWLPPVVLLIAIAGVLLARGRRRTLARTALGAAFACLVVAIALVIARSYYLDHLPAQVRSHDAAAAVFDTLVRFLRQSLVTTIVLGVLVALGAYAVGPGRLPVAVRRGCDHAAEATARWARARSVTTGRAGTWTRDHRLLTTLIAVVVVAVGFAAWNHPTVLVVLLLVLILLALLAVIALLAADGRLAEQDGKAAPQDGAPAG